MRVLPDGTPDAPGKTRRRCLSARASWTSSDLAGTILDGMRLLYGKAGLVVEPSAALGIAAILEDPARFAGKRVATIICGGNVVPDDFQRWVL